MAKKTAEPHPAPVLESGMDYAEHEKTYNGFMGAVKYSIISMAILVVGLYFAIIAEQHAVGIVLVIASIVVPAAMAILAPKN